MNIKRVKWSYLNIKKQKLEYKEELKHINDPINGVCNPKKEFPKQLRIIKNQTSSLLMFQLNMQRQEEEE